MEQAGQSLVEVLVAVGIILFALVGSAVAVTQSVKTLRVGGNQTEAGRYANQVIQQIQTAKNLDAESFFANQDCGSFGPFGDNLEYQVEVDCVFNSPAPDEAEVRVKVSWPEGDSNLSVVFETIVTKKSGY